MSPAPQFTGREFDPETGLYYYRSRYYAPQAGRFTTADPIGLLGGPNLYVYVNNNPTNWVDPWGLLGESIVKEQLDRFFPDKFTKAEKETIADFTGRQIKPWHLPGLMSGDERALKALEQRVRDALKKADKNTQETFEKLEIMKNQLEQEQKVKAEETGTDAPEPATMVLAGFGAAVLAFYRRKKERKEVTMNAC